MNNNSYEEYYLAVKQEKDFTVYTSDSFKFSEIDILNLIKICILDRRSMALGKKILLIYEDSTKERIKITRERLKNMGLINNETEKQTKRRNPKIR